MQIWGILEPSLSSSNRGLSLILHHLGRFLNNSRPRLEQLVILERTRGPWRMVGVICGSISKSHKRIPAGPTLADRAQEQTLGLGVEELDQNSNDFGFTNLFHQICF